AKARSIVGQGGLLVQTARGLRHPLRMNYTTVSIVCGNCDSASQRPLQNPPCPFMRRLPERWPSGLRRTLGKRVYVKAYRGFESHPLRQLVIYFYAIWRIRGESARFPRQIGTSWARTEPGEWKC